MYLIMLHKSLQETNRGSGDSHVISSWKPVCKNVSLSQIGIGRIGVARILSEEAKTPTLALAGGCTSCPAGVHLHIFPVN